MEDISLNTLPKFKFKYPRNEEEDWLLNKSKNKEFPFPISERVLYPIDFVKSSEKSSSIISLFQLCCDEITRNEKLLEEVCSYLPQYARLYYILIKSYIFNDFISKKGISILMSNWPSKTICVMKIMSDLVDKWPNDLLMPFAAVKFEQFLGVFLNILKRRLTPFLQVLDLRGMPIDGRTMYLLICDIVYLSEYILQTDDYHIIVDCKITSEELAEELTYLLKVIRHYENIKVHLHINRLDVSHLPQVITRRLLGQINLKDLTGLSLNVGFIYSSDNFSLKRFTSLIALNFCDSKDTYTENHLFNGLIELNYLPNLRRLGLGRRTFYLKNKRLNSISANLEFLDLHVTPLTRIKNVNLKFLLSVNFHLRELDISGQLIEEENIKHWAKFLDLSRKTLTSLEVEECIADEYLFQSLLNCIYRIENLRYLNLARNQLLPCTIIEETGLLYLRSIRNLEFVRLPMVDWELVIIYVIKNGYEINDWPEHIRGKFVENSIRIEWVKME